MKTLGLIGGISWQSTHIYHQYLNELVAERLGGANSAKILLNSFNFHEIEALQMAGDWDRLTQIMIETAKNLERAGADGLVICANTMHQMADAVETAIDIPLIHIADALAAHIKQAKTKKTLLLATKYTMEQPFYRERLSRRHGIDVEIPDEAGRQMIHDVIFNELVLGIVNADSKRAYLELISAHQQAGCDSVVLGCTEFGLLISQSDLAIPAFNSTYIHAQAAVDFALA